MAWFGLALFPATWIALVTTGLPAFMVLIGGALAGAALASAAGGSAALLTALPSRLIALLESDLLQALPLFVLMGMLLHKLPLAHILFRTGVSLGPRGPAGPRVAAIGLATLLAPLNGSVGASVAVLGRVVHPRFEQQGAEPSHAQALVAFASTLGVVIPPSLVLILLGDAMMSADTIASNLAGRHDRIINTQDLFRGVLPAAALLIAASLLIAGWPSRADAKDGGQAPEAAGRSDRVVAAGTVAFIVLLMGGVAGGLFYAVEAGAVGAVALLSGGFVSRRLTFADLAELLSETLVVTGVLFALLIAATSFTLVLRVLGTDRLVVEAVAAIPGGDGAVTLAVLGMLGVSALVLDAFEIIFVVVPIVMPALLLRVDDAVWIAVLTLLVLQASFLVPPLGFAVMMVRGLSRHAVTGRQVFAALAPYLVAQAAILALTFAYPQSTRLMIPKGASAAAPLRTEDEVRRELDRVLPPLPEPPRF